MMKSVVALALVASATAFAPAQQARQSTSLAAFADFPNGLAAINGPDAISSAGLLQIAALVAVLEIRVMTDVTGESEFRGDFRNGFDFGWDKQTEEWKQQKRAIELNNGRAAMTGILGLMVHEQLGGTIPLVGEM